MGDKLTAAQRAMVEETLWIVDKEVDWFMRGVHYNQEEIRENMRSAGGLALCLAALKWEPGGAPLSTFSRYRVRGALYDEINNLKGISRVQWQKYQKLQKAAAKNGLPWDDDRTAEAAGMTEKQADGARQAAACHLPVALHDIGEDTVTCSVTGYGHSEASDVLEGDIALVYEQAARGVDVRLISDDMGLSQSDVRALLDMAEDTIANHTDGVGRYMSKIDGVLYSVADSGRVDCGHLMWVDIDMFTDKQLESSQVSLYDNGSRAGSVLGRARRAACVCGSGKKYRECCGYVEGGKRR